MLFNRKSLQFLVPIYAFFLLSCEIEIELPPLDVCVGEISGKITCYPEIISNGEQAELYIQLSEEDIPWSADDCKLTIHYMIDDYEVASSTNSSITGDKYFICNFTPKDLSTGKHTISAVGEIDCSKHDHHVVNFRAFPTTLMVTESSENSK